MVSIITSLYKSDGYLNSFSKNLKTFAKSLKQFNIPFELVVIANDATEAELKFAADFKSEPWFNFSNVKREPLYATWNRGVGLAKGEVIGFWNVDDERYPVAVQEAVGLFQAGAELVHFPFNIKRYFKLGSWYLPLPAQKIDKQIPVFSQETKWQFLQGMVCGPFFMFTKTLYAKVGPFDEQFKIAGDFDWCVRAAKASDKIVKAKNLGGVFRVDGGGLSAGGSARQVVENNIIYQRNGIKDKILESDAVLQAQYRAMEILQNGEYKPL